MEEERPDFDLWYLVVAAGSFGLFLQSMLHQRGAMQTALIALIVLIGVTAVLAFRYRSDWRLVPRLVALFMVELVVFALLYEWSNGSFWRLLFGGIVASLLFSMVSRIILPGQTGLFKGRRARNSAK